MGADFVVVGGGIGGVVLAGSLGRGGKKVVVLQRSLAPPPWVQPEVLWPATMEVLFSLSPRELWEEDAVIPMRGVEFHHGQRILHLRHSFATRMLETGYDIRSIQSASADRPQRCRNIHDLHPRLKPWPQEV